MTVEPRGRNPLESLGAAFLGSLMYVGGMTLLLGQFLRWMLAGIFTRPVRFGWRPLAEQIVRVGASSLPIVILVQVFIGVILALQLTPPLAVWGQEGQVARIIGLGGFRMLGPIITAVVLSGFAGASIAAEIGTMNVSEEIEALEAIALNPVHFLVVPRVLATFVVTILLSGIADLMIALGGYLTSLLVLGPGSYIGYWRQMQEQLKYQDLYTGLIMAGVFGLLISLIACYEGLKVSGGAEGVGKATTMTVVYSIVSIVASATVFTALFYVYGL